MLENGEDLRYIKNTTRLIFEQIQAIGLYCWALKVLGEIALSALKAQEDRQRDSHENLVNLIVFA